MKFTVNFKTPDALYYALKNMEEDEEFKCKEFAEKYIKYGEYISVEFDTETRTVKVL